MYEGKIFHESVQLDGHEVSAFALAPARALSESSWRKSGLRRCLIIRGGGLIEECQPLGTMVHDGMLCLCVASIQGSVPLSALGLQDLGKAIGILAEVYACGRLEPGALDVASLRYSDTGLVVLTRPDGSYGSALPVGSGLTEPRACLAQALVSLCEQRRIFAGCMCSRLGHAVTGSFVPRRAGPGSVLVPALRSFLRDHGDARYLSPGASLKPALCKELSIWAKASEVIVGGNAIVEPTARRMAVAVMLDTLGGRFHAALAWGTRRRAAIMGVAIAATLAAVLGGPMVWRRFGPPLSAGMSAQELAERYLAAIVELDMSFIDSVLKPPAVLPYDYDLYAMAPVAAVRRGMKSPFLSAGSGALPAHEPEAPVWEIVDSSIRAFELSGDERAYAEIQYVLIVGTMKEDRVDRLILARRKGSWVVVDHTAIHWSP